MNKELATALLKAQGEMGKLLKDSNNPHFNSTYASLAAVLDTVRGPLTNAGLVLYQSATTDDGSVLVHSALIHAETGEAIEEVLSLPVAQRTPQALGSAITYGRRYLAMAMCGLAPDDDDGEQGSQPSKPQKQAKPQAPPSAAAHRQPPPQPKPQAPAPPPDLESDVDFGQGEGWDDLPNRAESDAQFAERCAALMHSDAEISDYATRIIAKVTESDRQSGDKTLSIVKKDGTGSGQYGLLVGKIDNLVGKNNHRYVLAALCGRVVSQENPPGWKVKELIDWLNDDGKKASTEQAIKDVWEACKQVEKVAA